MTRDNLHSQRESSLLDLFNSDTCPTRFLRFARLPDHAIGVGKVHLVEAKEIVEFESLEQAIIARNLHCDAQYDCPSLVKSPMYCTSLMVECEHGQVETVGNILQELGLCLLSNILFESRRQPGLIRFFVDFIDGHHFHHHVLPSLCRVAGQGFTWTVCTIPLPDRILFFNSSLPITNIDSIPSSKSFEIDLDRIVDSTDGRTTCMIRNIPNKYTQSMLIDMINETHYGTFDFIYLRMDFQNRCNVGYAFINFILPQNIVSFAKRVMGKRWPRFNSDKICQLTYARIQGKESLLEKFRFSK